MSSKQAKYESICTTLIHLYEVWEQVKPGLRGTGQIKITPDWKRARGSLWVVVNALHHHLDGGYVSTYMCKDLPSSSLMIYILDCVQVIL